MRLLVFDLFCGLGEAQLGGSTYRPIHQLVAGGAQYPNHVRMAVFYLPPRSVSSVVWPVSYFKNPIFPTRLAGLGEPWKFALQAFQKTILVRTTRIVNTLNHGVSGMESLSLLFGRFSRAAGAAISSIAVGVNYIKMLTATFTISPCFQQIGGLVALRAPEQIAAMIAAENFVWSFRGMGLAAVQAE